ncbi:MAG: cytochrome c maturation protein CcmE [Alphaproteobacteria bacterium]|nr:cytochrome c maturation protein CcmE [Alphaproteobacteria bacterium]
MRNKHKQKRIIFVGSIFAISLLALLFVIKNFRENIVFFYSPTELRQIQNRSRIVRIGGLVKDGSVKEIDALNTEFIVTDLQNELKIHYKGILPNLFRDKQGVVVKGVLNEDGSEFFSSELLIKHDENYMPPEVAKSLKR